MGFSTIAASTIALGAGEYLSSKAHREFVLAEKRRELWEFKHFKDTETKEVPTDGDQRFFRNYQRVIEPNNIEYL